MNKAPSPSSETEPKLEGNYYIWDKDKVYKLSEHFSTKEFSCHCHYPTCKQQRISKDLIDKLELIRIEAKQPLIITSAYRCSQHQAYLSAAGVNTVVAKKSQHELGNAADVVPKDGKDVQGKFLEICEKQFESIGLSNKFLHLDLRVGNRRWRY